MPVSCLYDSLCILMQHMQMCAANENSVKLQGEFASRLHGISHGPEGRSTAGRVPSSLVSATSPTRATSCLPHSPFLCF